MNSDKKRSITFWFSSVMVVTLAVLTIFFICLGYLFEYVDGTTRSFSSALFVTEMIIFIIMIGLLGVSSFLTGKKDGKLQLSWIDRIYTDVLIAVDIVIIGCMYPTVVFFYRGLMDLGELGYWTCRLLGYSNMSEDEIVFGFMRKSNPIFGVGLDFQIGFFSMIFIISFTLMVFLSMIRRIKAGIFWENTSVVVAWHHIAKCGGKSKAILPMVMGIMIGCVLLGVTRIGAIFALLFIIYFVPKWVNEYSLIKEGISELKQGNFDHRIMIDNKGENEFTRFAEDVNAIAEVQGLAVEKELKNQRLKTELISNVSHDLKTPLTSMVSYIDLLEKEGLESENAKEYLDIIQDKTNRLQRLTEDLFEAAKASSGDIPVNFEKVQVQSIIEQSLVEFDDIFKSKNITMLCSYPEEQSFVRADGKLLWRVVENIFSNLGKYAREDTRAYVDVTENGNKIYIDFKNISKEQLNIPPNELMERFKRGDESRTTDGSGLGLAISKDLANLMNGKFEIKIDGDLFKVTLVLEKY